MNYLHQDVLIRTCAPHRLRSSWLLGSAVNKTQLFQKLLICPHMMSMGFYYEGHTGSVEFLLKANRSPAENKEKPSGEWRLLWSVMFCAAFQHRKTGITFPIKLKKCSFQRLWNIWISRKTKCICVIMETNKWTLSSSNSSASRLPNWTFLHSGQFGGNLKHNQF